MIDRLRASLLACCGSRGLRRHRRQPALREHPADRRLYRAVVLTWCPAASTPGRRSRAFRRCRGPWSWAVLGAICP